MTIQLSDHFDYKRLLRFTVPSIAMMILVSLYSVVDALFVSNYVGETAFSAVNISYPIVYIVGAVGHLVGAGGSAVIGRTLGERKNELASRYFSMLTALAMIWTVVMSILCIVFIEPLMRLSGASDLLIEDCIRYGTIMFLALPFCVLQSAFSKFLMLMERPKIGLLSSVAAGFTNVVLDYVFIAVFDWGVEGAALATAFGFFVGGFFPVVYVLYNKDLNLRFTRFQFRIRPVLETAAFGASATINSLSGTMITILFNIQLMKLVGEAGVAAYGVICYTDYVYIGVFNGFAIGVAPIFSYHYGAGNKTELRNLLKRCLVIVTAASMLCLFLEQLLAAPVTSLFIADSPATAALTVEGFRIFAFTYLFCGFNIFISAFFSALCKGQISFGLSLLRAFILKAGLVMLLPLFWGTDGVWAAVVVSDALTILVSFLMLKRNRKEVETAAA